jgi:hypothetical protein
MYGAIVNSVLVSVIVPSHIDIECKAIFKPTSIIRCVTLSYPLLKSVLKSC